MINVKSHYSKAVFFIVLLNIPSLVSAQMRLFIDKNVPYIIKEFKKYARSDSVIHLTIDKNIEGVDYTIVGADTQEAAAKRKIQGIFKQNRFYVLLISNLENGIQIDGRNQARYRKWVSSYLKPQTIETQYPDPSDTTQGIMEIKTMHYHTPTMIIRYREGKFYDKNIYYE